MNANQSQELTDYIFESLRPLCRYDKKSRKVYRYSKSYALWIRLQTCKMITNDFYTLAQEYYDKVDIPFTNEIKSRLNSPWSNKTYAIVIRRLKERDDTDFIREHFDQKKELFPCGDKKVFDLKNKVLRDRTPSDYFTKSSDALYLPDFRKQEIRDYVGSLLMTRDNDVITGFLEHLYKYLYREPTDKYLFAGVCLDSGKTCFRKLMISVLGGLSWATVECLEYADKKINEYPPVPVKYIFKNVFKSDDKKKEYIQGLKNDMFSYLCDLA